jgi:hypothetical protein
VECATPALQPRLALLEQRLAAAALCSAAEPLRASSSALLARRVSEVDLAARLGAVPPYTLPPPDRDVADLPKKQLAAFLAEHWSQAPTCLRRASVPFVFSLFAVGQAV